MGRRWRRRLWRRRRRTRRRRWLRRRRRRLLETHSHSKTLDAVAFYNAHNANYKLIKDQGLIDHSNDACALFVLHFFLFFCRCRAWIILFLFICSHWAYSVLLFDRLIFYLNPCSYSV